MAPHNAVTHAVIRTDVLHHALGHNFGASTRIVSGAISILLWA